MKFTVKEPGGFRHDVQHFEEGNTYEKHGLTDAKVDMFHRAGWVSIEGRPDVARDPQRVVSLDVQPVSHNVG